MTEIPIIVSTNEVTVGGMVDKIDLQVGVGQQGPRGSRIFSGDVSPLTLASDSPFFAGYTEFIYGDMYIQRSASNIAVWEWKNQPGGDTWVKTSDIAVAGGGGSVTLDPDIAAIGALTGTGILRRTAPNTWVLDNGSLSNSFFYNVSDYGALGDGTTDDTLSIQSLLNSAEEGATIAFPRGTYRISSTLTPKRQQILKGVHSPKYDPSEFPTSTCALKATDSFTGTSLIAYQSGAAGVALENIALLGQGQETGSLDGIDMTSTNPGEKQWWIENVTISGFAGAGITGTMWVGDIRDSHIGRCGYGIRPTGSQRWTDVRVIGTQIYFNKYAGIEFDTTNKTGAVVIADSRIERSGNTYGDPATPLYEPAPGIRIGNAKDIQLVGVSTDACTGPGLDIGTTDIDKSVYNVVVTGSIFLRDGGGNQTDSEYAGVKISGADHVQFTTNIIGYGAHDDSSPDFISPFYGIWLEDTSGVSVGHSRIEAETFANSIHLEGTANYNLDMTLMPHAMMSVPAAASEPTGGFAVGSMFYDTFNSRPKWYTGTKWIDAFTGDGTYASTIGFATKLNGLDTISKYLAFESADVTKWVVSSRSASSNHNFTIDRHDSIGDYVDTPLSIGGLTGRLDTNHQYVTAKANDVVPMEIRPFTSPTVSWFKVASSGGTSALEVLYTGIPVVPTAAVDTNTTQIASTAYVVGQGYLKSATASSTYAPLASPTFSGILTGSDTTESSSSTTGAFKTAGGLGVAKNLYVGGNTVITGTLEASNFKDTGSRDVSADVTANATDTLDTVHIRRVGNIVYMTLKIANSATSTTHELFATLPDGFKPVADHSTYLLSPNASSASQTTVVSVDSSNGQTQYRNNNSATMCGTVVYVTNDAWPSSLPGSAA